MLRVSILAVTVSAGLVFFTGNAKAETLEDSYTTYNLYYQGFGHDIQQSIGFQATKDYYITSITAFLGQTPTSTMKVYLMNAGSDFKPSGTILTESNLIDLTYTTAGTSPHIALQHPAFIQSGNNYSLVFLDASHSPICNSPFFTDCITLRTNNITPPTTSWVSTNNGTTWTQATFNPSTGLQGNFETYGTTLPPTTTNFFSDTTTTTFPWMRIDHPQSADGSGTQFDLKPGTYVFNFKVFVPDSDYVFWLNRSYTSWDETTGSTTAVIFPLSARHQQDVLPSLEVASGTTAWYVAHLEENSGGRNITKYFVTYGKSDAPDQLFFKPLDESLGTSLNFLGKCPIKFMLNWDPCYQIGTVIDNGVSYVGNLPSTTYHGLLSRKPWHYIIQVQDAVRDWSLATSTATSSLNFTYDVQGIHVPLFRPTTTLTRIVNQSQWDQIRPSAVVAVHVLTLFSVLAIIL